MVIAILLIVPACSYTIILHMGPARSPDLRPGRNLGQALAAEQRAQAKADEAKRQAGSSDAVLCHIIVYYSILYCHITYRIIVCYIVLHHAV